MPRLVELSMGPLVERVRSVNRHQMAKHLGCDPSHVSKVCSGQRMPALKMAMGMARYLGCSVEELVAALAVLVEEAGGGE